MKRKKVFIWQIHALFVKLYPGKETGSLYLQEFKQGRFLYKMKTVKIRYKLSWNKTRKYYYLIHQMNATSFFRRTTYLKSIRLIFEAKFADLGWHFKSSVHATRTRVFTRFAWASSHPIPDAARNARGAATRLISDKTKTEMKLVTRLEARPWSW